MAEIGKYNKLKVLRKVDFGYYLDGKDLGDILIPLRYAPEPCQPGDEIEVFLYLDSEDRFIATTEKPFAIVGEFACLKVVSVNAIGAFLDWGLPKNLLVPFREQKQKMEEGKEYIVFIYIDAETNRIAASAKLSQFLNIQPANYLPGDEVDLFIISETDLGFKASVNNRHDGIIYKNEVFKPLKRGQKLKGYIRKLRPDGKIDLRLHPEGYEKIESMTAPFLSYLESKEGFISMTDKSPATEIYSALGISKKDFKKIVGLLLKKRIISLSESGISIL